MVEYGLMVKFNVKNESAIKETTLQLDESEGLARKRLRLANDSNLDQALYH